MCVKPTFKSRGIRCCKFKVNLFYIVTFRLASETLSQKRDKVDKKKEKEGKIN